MRERERVGLKESIGVYMKKGMLLWFGHAETPVDGTIDKTDI